MRDDDRKDNEDSRHHRRMRGDDREERNRPRFRGRHNRDDEDNFPEQLRRLKEELERFRRD
jgi:hypothetical protein